MSVDPAFVQRLSQSIALAFEQVLSPLRDEIDTLRAEVAALRGTHTDSPVPAAARAAVVAGRATRTRGAVKSIACQVPDCPAPVLAKELCETHYRVMRRALAAGEPFDPRSQRPAGTRTGSRGCRAGGCNEAHYAKGLCRRHYMAARARARAQGGDIELDTPLSVVPDEPDTESGDEMRDTPTSSTGEFDTARFTFAVGGSPSQGLVAMPTANMVMRVVQQHRGNLWKVAEVLGRNRSTLMELLDALDLFQDVTDVRKAECERIKAAPLADRLADLLYREKLLEDLKCLKEVDDATREEVQFRAATLAKGSETQEDVLEKLGRELNLDASGVKRLAWRYQLRRQLRGLRSKQAPRARARV